MRIEDLGSEIIFSLIFTIIISKDNLNKDKIQKWNTRTPIKNKAIILFQDLFFVKGVDNVRSKLSCKNLNMVIIIQKLQNLNCTRKAKIFNFSHNFVGLTTKFFNS